VKIALFIGQIYLDTQSKVIKGVYSECKKNNIDLHVFSLYSSIEHRYNVGEFEYLNRMEFSIFDGFILYTETLYNTTLRSMLISKLKAFNKPSVSIDGDIRGIVTLRTDNYEAMYKLVCHLIEKHNAKTLNFISGPVESRDSELRKKAFLDAAYNHKIDIDPDRIYTGTFVADSGAKAVRYFEDHKLLNADAYVCANDQMALGVYYALKNRNIRVPDDACVTGFDNILQAQCNVPSITSIERHEVELGVMSCQKLISIIKGNIETDCMIPAEPIYRQSCCAEETKDIEQLIEYYAKVNINNLKYANVVNESANELVANKDIDSLSNQLPKYLNDLSITEFCMCLDSDISLIDIDIPIYYLNGSCDKFKLPRNKVFPKMKDVTYGNFYIYSSLHYLDHYFGYIITTDIDLSLGTSYYHMFINNICTALESIDAITKMDYMIKLLEQSSYYDALTHLYNRVGFFKEAEVIMSSAKKLNEPMFLMFADLDGLKLVNDNLGHEAGDAFICAFADILNTICEDEIVMRFGGDEFVIFGKNKSAEDIRILNSKISKAIEQRNSMDSKYKPYDLSVSIGYYDVDCDNEESLLSLIDRADKKMYHTKMLKKRRRNNLNN